MSSPAAHVSVLAIHRELVPFLAKTTTARALGVLPPLPTLTTTAHCP
jgi:hypothetical protein